MKSKLSYIFVLGAFLIPIFFLFIYYFPVTSGAPAFGSLQIWKHRCNSIDSAQHYSRIFQGIEIDAVYSETSDYLDVRHDIDSPNSHLDLWTLLDSTRLTGTKYWLDLKNLTVNNSGKILNILDAFVRQDSTIKERLIVESNVPDALNELSKKGYHTSYWVPHYENSLLGYIKFFIRTKPVLIKYQFNALSAQYRMLPLLSFFYPEHNFHVWTDDSNNSDFAPILDSLSNIQSVKVILVDYVTPPIVTHR